MFNRSERFAEIAAPGYMPPSLSLGWLWMDAVFARQPLHGLNRVKQVANCKQKTNKFRRNGAVFAKSGALILIFDLKVLSFHPDERILISC